MSSLSALIWQLHTPHFFWNLIQFTVHTIPFPSPPCHGLVFVHPSPPPSLHLPHTLVPPSSLTSSLSDFIPLSLPPSLPPFPSLYLSFLPPLLPSLLPSLLPLFSSTASSKGSKGFEGDIQTFQTKLTCKTGQ